MSRISRLSAIMFLIITITVSTISGQSVTDRNQEWLMIEKGRQAILDRELGDALRIFRTILGEASQDGRVVPEAEMWLGYIFEQEGETDLAVEQYTRALNNADLLYVNEDKYSIMYRLSNIYEMVYQYGKYEQTLKRIIREGSNEENGAALFDLQESMFNALVRDGIDKLFILYRKDERKLQPAYSRLGLYHYKTGFYREAVRNYISSLITPVTNCVNYMRKKDFTYQYIDLPGFILDCGRDPFLKEYLEEVSFTKDLYYLAAALYGMGNTGRAREIWQAVIYSVPNSSWGERSNRQLTEPFIEPILSPALYE